MVETCDEVLRDPGPVLAPPVPHDDDGAAKMTKQLPQEDSDVRALERPLRDKPSEQAQAPPDRRDRQGRDRGDLLPITAGAKEKRSLGARSPSPPDQGEQRKAALILEDYVGPPARGPLFMRAQSRRFQRSIARSSRS